MEDNQFEYWYLEKELQTCANKLKVPLPTLLHGLAFWPNEIGDYVANILKKQAMHALAILEGGGPTPITIKRALKTLTKLEAIRSSGESA